MLHVVCKRNKWSPPDEIRAAPVYLQLILLELFGLSSCDLLTCELQSLSIRLGRYTVSSKAGDKGIFHPFLIDVTLFSRPNMISSIQLPKLFETQKE